ncbi:diguanylate cyclase [Candidatus Woesearchaeota archaeon]|nr:diguanylate cyclase [Candidatus Woesearchaeota archaeon]
MKDSIFDRVDKELWQEVQDKFSKEIKLPVVTIDLEGNKLVSSNKFPFICDLFKSKKVSLCKKEWLLHLYKSKNQEGIYFFPCKGGLFNIMSNVKLLGEVSGAIIVCGIRKDDNFKDYSQVSVQLGVEKSELIDAFNEVRKLDDEEIRKTAELLNVFSKIIPSIAKKSYDSNRKNYELDILLKLLSIAHNKKRLEGVVKSVMGCLIDITKAIDCSVLVNSDEDVKKFSYKNETQIGIDNEKKLMHQKACSLINVNKELGLNVNNEYNNLLVVPLTSKEKELGTVFLYGVKELKEEELGFYSVLGQEISLVILNAIQYEEIETLAIKDKLTGIYNRRYFMKALEKEVTGGNPISLMLLDIDDFGNYNNSYGHQQGDFLLKGISKLLKENTRVIDIVGRYGGEEFIILLPDTKSTEAVQVAERIRSVIENHTFNEKVTVSIGLISCMDKRMRAEELIREADKALYQAKSAGKNRIIKRVIIDKNMSRYDL